MVTCIGLVSPGAMGAAVGRTLTERGHSVVALLDGRSEATRERATAAGIKAVGSLEELVGAADLVLSIVPPGAAVEVATAIAGAVQVAGASPLVVDCNAVSPATARTIAGLIEDSGARFVDGDIIGGPPKAGLVTSLYLSGAEAAEVADTLNTPELHAVSIGTDPAAASALKMCYAAWTKGTSALLLSIRAVARAEGVEAALLDAWRASLPDIVTRSEGTISVAPKAWRWVAEMEEIAATFAAAGLPPEWGQAMADVYRRLSDYKDVDPPPPLDDLLRALTPDGG